MGLVKTAKKRILTRHSTGDNISKFVNLKKTAIQRTLKYVATDIFCFLFDSSVTFFSLVGIFLLSVLYHFYSSCFKFGAPVIPRQSKQVKQVLKNSACAGPGLVSSLKIMCIFLSSVVFYLEKISFNLKLFKFSYSCMNGPPRKFPYSSYFVL